VPAGSRVVCVTDGRLWRGPGWGDADLDPAVARAMLGRGLMELTGAGDPSAALIAIIPAVSDPSQRYAIKVNAVNPTLPSHPVVVGALVELLVAAGASATSIVVFDREDGELERAGFVVGDGPAAAVRGTDHEPDGYGEPVPLTDATVRPARLLDAVDHVINVPVLKQHEMTGMTGALKNHFGSIDRPQSLHGRARDCSPGIAEVAALPAIRDKTRLVVMDAAFATYRGGLMGAPEVAPLTLALGIDPVAVDTVGQEIVNARRARDGLDPLVARHLLDAAARGLGVADLARIDRVDVTLAPVVERLPPAPATSCGCGTAVGSRQGGARLGAAALGAAAVGLALRRRNAVRRGRRDAR